MSGIVEKCSHRGHAPGFLCLHERGRYLRRRAAQTARISKDSSCTSERPARSWRGCCLFTDSMRPRCSGESRKNLEWLEQDRRGAEHLGVALELQCRPIPCKSQARLYSGESGQAGVCVRVRCASDRAPLNLRTGVPVRGSWVRIPPSPPGMRVAPRK